MARLVGKITMLLLLIALLGVTPARAASETSIGFDRLPDGTAVPAGTVVTNQWEVEGLELGTAKGFGQEKVAGDCGSPTVQAQTAVAGAASPPNFAVLATCFAAFNTQGTFGALLGQARGSLSVKVRNVGSGTGVQVHLTGYDSAGKVVASGSGEAGNTGWQTIAAALNGGGKISYFAIATELVTSQQVAIDDLGYEPLPWKEPSTEEPKTTPPPKPPPPVASLALQTPNPQAGTPLTLSGAGSTPGSGRIISYGWNFRGGSNVETSTGTNPIAHVMLGPGAHTIALTVTNSSGEKSTSHFGVTVPTNIHVHPPDGGEGECVPTLEIGDAQLLAECIQKLSGGGYVIAGQLEINGMTIAVKSGGFLKIRTVRTFGVGTFTQLYGAQVYVELLNTPIGDMVLGERNLETEPMDLEFKSEIAHLPGPVFHDFRGPTARAADKPAKTLLMAIGVGKECSGGEKKAGCCPPKNALTACATLPGNFPLTGQIDVYLTNKGQALFDAQVGLSLKDVNFEATGAVELRANLETGIELSSLQFEIGEASLAPIFKVTKASFVYYFPEYEEESKRDSWQAKGTITFGEEIAELEAELAFKKGNFQSASMKFKANPGVPIYPGISLNEIGASVGVEPLAFGGSLGAKIAELLELELAFKFREATSTELGFFGGEGKLSYKDDDIATLAADVYSDGYVDAQVTFNLHFPFESKEPVIEVSGGAGFWDEPSSGLWQAKGNVYMKLWILSAEVAALINNQYAAGCLHVGAEGIFGGGVQGRYRFSDGNVSGGLFGNDNCSDQLKQYSQKPLVKHSGGFVKEEAARFPAANGAASRRPVSPGGLLSDDLGSVGGPLASAAAGGESDSFTLPNGTTGQELRISSAAGTPVVALLGPGGQTYTTPTTAGHLVTVPGQFMSAVAPDPHQVLVLLRHPKGGTWSVQALPGSPAIATLEAAEDVAPAVVHVHVRRAHGHRWSLAYKIDHFVAGTHVRLVERGKDSTHVLASVGKAKGTLTFAPTEALGRSRTVYAYLLDSEGVVVRELTVAHYTAPAAQRPAKPRRLRFVRHGASALVSWAVVPGARSYRIKVRGSDGRLQTFFRKPGARSVSIANVLPFESFTASVTAVGAHELRGRAASVTLKALKPPRARHQRRSGKRKH
jgi:PKD repeat protein